MNHSTAIERRAILATGPTAVMWGVTGIFVGLLPPTSPLSVTAGRLGGALIAALPIFATSNTKRSSLKETLKNPFTYVLASLLTGYYLLATAGFQLAAVAEVALLLSISPLFVLALRRVLGDAPTVLELFGVGLAVAGIALILGPRLTLAERFGNRRVLGDVLAICAALLTALYVYVYRHLAKNRRAPEPTSVTLMTFVLGSVALTAIRWVVPTRIPSEAFSGTNLLIFLCLAILCTAIPSFAFASEPLPSVVTATISLLIPLSSAAFAFVILGENVSSTAIPGSVLVVAGILVILRQTSQVRGRSRPIDLGAEAVATKIGLAPGQLFKTPVAQGDRHGICMAVIPSDAELDLKTIAAASDNRKIHLVPVKELEKLTGYVRGGGTAIAAKKTFPVYVDNSIERFELISVSAGVRGLQILLAPADGRQKLFSNKK